MVLTVLYSLGFVVGFSERTRVFEMLYKRHINNENIENPCSGLGKQAHHSSFSGGFCAF